MTILTGFKSSLGFKELTSTSLVTTDPVEFVYVDNFKFNRDQSISQLDEVGIQGRAKKRMMFGDINATGSFTKNIDTENGIALYKYIIGGSVTTASIGSGTFTHTFSESDEVLEAGGKVMRLQFTTNLGGQTGTSRIWWNGIVDSYSLNCANTNDVAKETINLKFSDHGSLIANTMCAVSLTQVNPIVGRKVTIKLGATITVVSVTVAKNINFTINNNVKESRELSGTNTVKDFQYGVKDISGSFDLTFDSHGAYDNFVNNTSVAIQVNLLGDLTTSGTVHSISFNFPECYYTGSHPEVAGTGQLTLPIKFVANYGSNAGYQVNVQVVNSTGTLVI